MPFEAIPASLAERAQWLIWRFEENPKKPGGKQLKVPYYANGARRTGGQGSDRDRSRLVTLPRAIQAMQKGGYTGIGFAFLPDDGLIGVDLDKVIDTETGEVSRRALEIIAACASYTEYSPSRAGVHIICRGKTVTFKNDAIGVEVFCSSQFFTFTGERFPDTPPDTTQLAPEVLERLRVLVDEARKRSRKAAPTVAASGGTAPPDKRAELERALTFIHPDAHYWDWLKTGMALWNELGDAGLQVWDYWSSRGSKYQGRESLETHWRSFRAGVEPTCAFIYSLAKQAGYKPPPHPDAAPRTNKVPKSSKKPKSDGASPPSNGFADEGAGSAPGASDAEESEEGPAKPKRKRAPEFWDLVDSLLDRFTLIYSTDTAYDHVERIIIKVAAMRLAFGKDPVNFWLNNRDRHMVVPANVVFDPSEKVDSKTHVNMFHGWPLKPDASKPCEKVLALLHFLCAEDDAVYDWVLKWIAYPLQHPGAKMESAILIHGDEGGGKNQFWSVVRQIYGAYSSIITQNELDSQFNTWASRKLFMIANEVVSRSEIRDQKGRLKNYITEPVVQINEKMLPLREESNQMNFVFFSNETQPLLLDRGDRRYQVIWTPDPQPEGYYKAVGEEIAAGAAHGLYAYLLQYPLDGFNEHSKPLMTTAKQDLIDMAKTPPELFHDAWLGSHLPLPVVPALAEDLYAAFQRWCLINGERPNTSTRFFRMMRRLKVRKDLLRVQMPGSPAMSSDQQKTIYFPSSPPNGLDGSPMLPEEHKRWVNNSISEFWSVVEAWRKGEL